MTAYTTWAAGSATGLVRSLNEDAAYAGCWLYAVADGMGGHVAGEVASAAAITALASYDARVPPRRLADVLGQAISDANAAIHRRTEDDPALRTMGTTLTAMLWSGHTFALGNIGDSRAYRLRDGQLRQLTEDHALHNLVASTRASTALGSLISRFLDGRPGRSPDLTLREALPGDRYLLCSDGVSGVVPDEVLREALTSGGVPAAAVARLTELANSAGGPDNITAIVVDVAPGPVHGDGQAPVTLGSARSGATTANR